MQFGIKFPAHRLQQFFRGHLLVFFVVFADRLKHPPGYSGFLCLFQLFIRDLWLRWLFTSRFFLCTRCHRIWLVCCYYTHRIIPLRKHLSLKIRTAQVIGVGIVHIRVEVRNLIRNKGRENINDALGRILVFHSG